MHALVIHGGAGLVLDRIADLGGAAQYEASLGRILDTGFDVLERGGASLDAVTAAVCMLEDDPLFNAAHGAGLASDGSAELDASIMDGRDQGAGAVAAVRHVKNPVKLARLVMEKSRHVLLVGDGAEEFAMSHGATLVPNEYFRTEYRRLELESERSGKRIRDLRPGPQGTVGAVALDSRGNLAAATSTGGPCNKLPGRVGDSPIVGAGVYAKNGVCGVSTTGDGEYFIRTVGAHHIAAAVEYRGLTLESAVRELVHEILPGLGGGGGVIAIDARGTMVMQFNTQGMFRAERDSGGRRAIETV
jgi:L-asparaginase / beta-aspartyl-peptidase